MDWSVGIISAGCFFCQHGRIGQKVSVKEKSRNLPVFVSAKEELAAPPPAYLQHDVENMTVHLLYLNMH